MILGSTEDLFVGGVAVLLGALALLAAILNRDWYYQLPKTRWIEKRWGRIGARVFYASVGLALLALGVCVILGLHQRGEPAPARQPAAALPDPLLDRHRSVTNGLPSGNAQMEGVEHFAQCKRAENHRCLRRLSSILTNETVSLL
jgi:hypothetical protein